MNETSRRLNVFLSTNHNVMLRELDRLCAVQRMRIRKDPKAFVDSEHVTPSVDVRVFVNLGRGEFWFEIGDPILDPRTKWEHSGYAEVTLEADPEDLLGEMVKQMGGKHAETQEPTDTLN